MDKHEILLTGCTPVPLAHYLKALGILRLVAEQKDPTATGRWQGEYFELRSTLDHDALQKFFLEEYRPTPIVVPWSGSDYFDVHIDGPAKQFSKTPTSSLVIEALLSTSSERFGAYRYTIRETLKAMAKAGVVNKKSIEGSGKPQRKRKVDLLLALRSVLPDNVVQWLDASTVIETESTSFNALLGGGGGSDGNSHFSDNYMQCLWMVLPDFRVQRASPMEVSVREPVIPNDLKTQMKWKKASEKKAACLVISLPMRLNAVELAGKLYPGNEKANLQAIFVEKWESAYRLALDTGVWDINASDGSVFDPAGALGAALFHEHLAGANIAGLSPVLFDSGRWGGPNQTNGFSAGSASNPWDYIFMLEGAMLFAGALGRKLDSASPPSARFPFMFQSSPVGLGAPILNEAAGKELWLPLWGAPTTLGEVLALLAEGRVEKHGHMARNGADVFASVAQLGFDRGIVSFQRIGFFKGRIGGDNYFTAVDQGRIYPSRNLQVDLLSDVDRRMGEILSATRSDQCPSAVLRSFKRIEQKITSLAVSSSDVADSKLLDVLAALGDMEMKLGKSLKWTKKAKLQPLAGLNKQWIEATIARHTPEFRLAASLAGLRMYLGKNETLHFRQHLEQVEVVTGKGRSWTKWLDNTGNDAVWHDGDLTDSLNEILTRRLVRAQQAGVKGWPDWSPSYATLEDITAFIEGRTDDKRLAELLWGLILVDWELVAEAGRERWAARENDTSNAPIAEADPFLEAGVERADRTAPSSLYTLLRLCFQRKIKDEDAIPIVPGILLRAMNGDGLAASKAAVRRLRGSGIAPLVDALPVQGDVARRTAAAMLFPISPSDMKRLTKTIIKLQPENA